MAACSVPDGFWKFVPLDTSNSLSFAFVFVDYEDSCEPLFMGHLLKHAVAIKILIQIS